MAFGWVAAFVAMVQSGMLGAEGSPPGQWIAPEVSEFSEWSVACDNARECTALSVSRDYLVRVWQTDPGDYATPKLWVTRRAGPDARARVIVDTTVWGEAGAGEPPASLHVYTPCDGDCTGRAYRLLPLQPGRYELAPADVAGFLAESVQTDRAATRFADGRMHGIITTAGMTASLRFIDEVQQRRGTVTAFFAKGPRPARSVPPAPPLPRVAVVRGETTALETPIAFAPGILAARAQLCPEAPITGRDPLQVRYRLDSGQFLLGVGCSPEGQPPRRLWLIETPGHGFAPFALPRPEQGRLAEVPILPNSSFDPASGLLTAFSGEHCGWRRRWAWTGRAFAMVDAVEMPSCYGIPQSQWLQTYRAIPG
ncbi:DUF1176 domain-containing protein [Porphyrobacter sp. YT40]|uniref:DUF1176 domain-containing protein n=1 Tax=Porphyrobacter sp. YT40 TaxID=2547601 RepID=UPI0015E8C58F|nr:DUF1176 domain-containing protein [Porphyrobacter sp. YT40]